MHSPKAPLRAPAPTDPWLERWLPLVVVHADGAAVLELGCGGGRDTRTLAAAGLRVVGIDLSAEAIEEARARVPTAQFHCQDIRAPFPLPAGTPGVVLASLSLHYFDWPGTMALVERIRQQLRPGGLLLCRLNSTRDFHHGARRDVEAGADNFYLVDGIPKRFFDRAAIDRLFASDWRVVSVDEQVVERYQQPKVLWEVILERRG
jgi:SAM-dependent methyltransferase